MTENKLNDLRKQIEEAEELKKQIENVKKNIEIWKLSQNKIGKLIAVEPDPFGFRQNEFVGVKLYPKLYSHILVAMCSYLDDLSQKFSKLQIGDQCQPLS